MIYTYDRKLKKDKYSLADVKKLIKQKKRFWVHLTKPPLGELEELGKILGLHHLVIEDIHHINNRAKIEDHGKYVYIVSHAVSSSKDLHAIELDLALSKNWVLSVTNKPIKSIESLLDNQIGQALKRGTDFLAHKVIDVTIDETTEIVDKINSNVEKLESQILKTSDK